MSTISISRLQDLSVLYYIKDQVLPFASWIESSDDAALTYNSKKGLYLVNSTTIPDPISKGRGWVYFDAQSSYLTTPSTEQASRVVVYNASSSVISTDNYTVNYLKGGLVLDSNAQGNPATIDYIYSYVSVVIGWVGKNPPPLPIVAILPMDFGEEGYELGMSEGYREQGYKLEVFATSSDERRDLLELLRNAFSNKCVALVDYRESGEPLKRSGVYNTSYAADTVSTINGGNMKTGKAYANEPRGNRANWSDVNRYRGSVTFVGEFWRASNATLSGF